MEYVELQQEDFIGSCYDFSEHREEFFGVLLNCKFMASLMRAFQTIFN